MVRQPPSEIPAPLTGLVEYIDEHPELSIAQILGPYYRHEAYLRAFFAQDGRNPILDDPYINTLPLFPDKPRLITTRARYLASETEEEKSRYIMPLPVDKRRKDGSPAIVSSLAEFQRNFSIFSESSLAEMDWSNVVAAGSSVVNCLLPVPSEYKVNKRKLRQYFHEVFCPASDVDLFLYGLTEEEAIQKIKAIEEAVRDTLLKDVTVVRTKYAITIASHYPTRHIQIVLRVYKSISEILTGFDIDAAGGAYDGKQVHVTPRALASFITQVNQIDLTRRSPSYETRLAKYSKRNFEVHWADLDRSRIDPTIYERSFKRTIGLARLLVLESLPTESARHNYQNERRRERGRPELDHPQWGWRDTGDMKQEHENEVSDWFPSDEVSNYHTFTIPYGRRFTAKGIERMCYSQDLLLNAEWNQKPEKRKVYLHRHPAFFGRVEDVIQDCCGCCPIPTTDEEKEVSYNDTQRYISGAVSFITDDPGRQEIGSFNPSTEQDWTEMAYIGNTERLFRSIFDGDLKNICVWLAQDGVDVNRRDHTGRTPLHFAAHVSTAEVVKCLVEHGARLTARLADGRTALHLAASRGETDIIRILMDKSTANEEISQGHQRRKRQKLDGEEASGRFTKQDARDAAIEASSKIHKTGDTNDSEEEEYESTAVVVEDGESDDYQISMTTGSFAKINRVDPPSDEMETKYASDVGPDFYDVDIPAWDIPCSALHLAVSGGHEDAVKTLCDYGADTLLPVEFRGNRVKSDVILTLALTLSLPVEKAKSMLQLLIELGALSSQTDPEGISAFHRLVAHGSEDLVDTLIACDGSHVTRALKCLYIPDVRTISALHTAIDNKDLNLVPKLLNFGVKPDISFDMWLRSVKLSPMRNMLGSSRENKLLHRTAIQPLLYAVMAENYQAAVQLLEFGADPNSLTPDSYKLLQGDDVYDVDTGSSVLDAINSRLKEADDKLSKANEEQKTPPGPPKSYQIPDHIRPGSYQFFYLTQALRNEKLLFESDLRDYGYQKDSDQEENQQEIESLEKQVLELQELKEKLISRGGKSFKDLHPDFKEDRNNRKHSWMRSWRSDSVSSDSDNERIKFRGDRNMTSAKQEAYIRLMEAAWEGKLDVIQSLTVQCRGPVNNQPRLLISIEDDQANCPFSLAFYRGHHKVAAGILEIVSSQWTTPENINKMSQRRRLHRRETTQSSLGTHDPAGSGMDLDSEEEKPRELQLGTVNSSVDEDNLSVNSSTDDGAQLVASDKTPMQILQQEWQMIWLVDGDWVTGPPGTVFGSCICENDAIGLDFLIGLAQYWEKYCRSQGMPDGFIEERLVRHRQALENERDGIFILPNAEFEKVLHNGDINLVRLVMKKTGAGLILDDLIQRSGEKLEQKSEYYPGLTVYGKKRKDWANIVPPGGRRRARNRRSGTSNNNLQYQEKGVPPVIHAVRSGRIEIVEFFLSDTPMQLYSEFSKSDTAVDNPKILHLVQSKAGFDTTVSKWLGASNHLLIHHALLIQSASQAADVLRYLIRKYPDAVEYRDSTGHTPLLIAARIGRISLAEILMREGHSDQTVSNSRGENILHLALQGPVDSRRFCELTKLIDPGLLNDLFIQRKKLSANGTVPLHSWISIICGYPSRDGDSDIYSEYEYGSYTPLRDRPAELLELLKTLLGFSNDKILESFNDAGDTCLHTAIKSRQFAIVRGLIQHRPALVYRENAMGQTPLDLANDLVIRATIKPARQLMLNADKEDRFLSARAMWNRPVPETKALSREVGNLTEPSLKETLRKLGLSGDYSGLIVSRLLYLAGLKENDDVESSTRINAIAAKKIILDFCITCVQENPGIPRALASVIAANDVARRVAELKSTPTDMEEEHSSMADAMLHRDIAHWRDSDGRGDVEFVRHLRYDARRRRIGAMFRPRRPRR